ncbi:MAG: hypothetical protein IJ493_02935 [Clostridia bacterium]|nr:hypothetical protein [Clostridia bacterium]
MTYRPKQNGAAKKVAFLLLLIGILIMMISSLDIPLRAVLQIIAILCVVVGLQYLTRYVLSDFRYVLEDNDDGSADLLIFKAQGQREAKVAHVALNRTVAFFKRDTLKDYQAKYGKTSHRFNYCQNPDKAVEWLLIFKDGEDLIEVIFEPDAAFVNEMNKRIGSGGDGMNFVM